MKPLLRVVLSVMAPGVLTGVAMLRVRPGWLREALLLTAEMARWARRPWCSRMGKLRDAIVGCVEEE